MRICKNKITQELRDLFGANPLRVPNDLYQPLLMLEIVDGSPKPLGLFPELIKGDFRYDLEVKTATLAEISEKKTRKVKLNFGMELLGNFFKAFGVDPVGLEVGLSNTKSFSFTFSNVERRYFSPLALGKILSENEIVADTDNFVIRKIIEDRKLKLALVTDSIVSNNFSITTYDEQDNSAKINLPTIKEYLTNVNAGIEASSQAENTVSFKYDTPLTFAFSCMEIEIDIATGKITRGDWLEALKSRDLAKPIEALTEEEKDLNSKLLFDDNEYNPLLIE